ncbi:hypothetical protein FEP89_05429 [Burkholderia multivorans]|nr:hypothetical protein [Burkholderia multivorans]
MIAATRARSASARPASGSSSSSRRARVASDSAISSRRCSPCDRLSHACAARSTRPTAASSDQVCAFCSSSLCASRHRPRRSCCAACTATRTFSNTVRLRNTLRIWNERLMPSRTRRNIASFVTSRPSNVIVPALGDSTPVSMLKKVVLPAPFGPMKLCSRYGWTSRSIRSAVTSEPKCFDRPRTLSTGVAGSESMRLARYGAMTSGRAGIVSRTSVQRDRRSTRCTMPWMPSGEKNANAMTIGAKISHQCSVRLLSLSSSRMNAIAPHSGPRNWWTPPSTVISRLSPACSQLRLFAYAPCSIRHSRPPA